MSPKEVIQQLESMGTAQNRKVYGRHGVRGEQFGVSYANLGKLKKHIKVNHSLAKALWGTGNHDAKLLATMVADPTVMTAADLDAWAHDIDNYMQADALAGLASKTKHARVKMEKWAKSKGEWVGSAGWQIMAHLALKDDTLSDAYLDANLKTIEKEIHGRKNRVRFAMNGALIAIGMRNATLEEKALAVAKRIGKVEVDHGETGCKTPDAAAYIKKATARKKR